MKKRSQQVRRRRQQQQAPFVSAVEQMEPRQLLSGAAFVEAGGRLVVRGTSGNDTITVTAKAGDASKLSVVVNGTVREFASKIVANVKIEAGDGNDRVQADTRNGAVNQGIFFLGGRGNDTLVSTTGNDAMVGEGGDDILVGTTGNNFLNGGIGNDKIYAGAGNDTLNGEAGNDYFHNAGGKDQVITGPGSNQVVTAAIPSNIPGVGSVAGSGLQGPTPAPAPAPTAPTPKPAAPSTPAPAPNPTPSQPTNNQPFVIGVWSQPHWHFDDWKARGINTVVGYESLSGTVSTETFSDEAVRQGMYMIRHANADPSKDLKYKNLLAWMQNDEPDYHNTPASVVQAEYNKLKKVAPNMPVFMNFAGSFALWGHGGKTKADYQAWMKGADWISNDIYPITAHNRPSALDAPGLAVERLADWSGGKRQFAVIEASDQELSDHKDYPGVNPDQFRAEVFNAIIKGATGIIYFPQKIGGGFLFNNMKPEVEAEMKRVNSRISRVGTALMQQVNPSGASMDVDGDLRVTWRKHGGKTYFVVLNNSNKTLVSTMDVKGVSGNASVDGENRSVAIKNGQITDTFKPYEAHVYVVG